MTSQCITHSSLKKKFKEPKSHIYWFRSGGAVKRLAESRCQDATFTVVIPAGLENKPEETWGSDIQSTWNLRVQDALQAVCVCVCVRGTYTALQGQGRCVHRPWWPWGERVQCLRERHNEPSNRNRRLFSLTWSDRIHLYKYWSSRIIHWDFTDSGLQW